MTTYRGGSVLPWHYRVKTAINTALAGIVPTQATNLALLVSAHLQRAKPFASRNWLELIPSQRNGASPLPSTTCFIAYSMRNHD
jgi:hypothetical protein